MEVNKTYCQFHFVGFKHTGRFDQYPTLIGEAFKELNTKKHLIQARTSTTAALYEPCRGAEHVEGYFYVGYIVEEKPELRPEGSEYIYIDGSYAGASGQIKNMSQIYACVVEWIVKSGYKKIWPNSLHIEKYEFPIPDDLLIMDEKVEVLLHIE